MNKWDARFGVFWYNDDELFKFTQEDFNRKAKEFSDSGTNIVMTFSCTHFRWSMHKYWDIIDECIKKLVKACHKYDIEVVEHHSSHLTFNPENEEELDWMKRVLSIRKSSIDSWEGLEQHVNDEIYENGFKVSSFRQIDGRTGEYARTTYKGYGMCFNNPDYVITYFKYLERMYKLGIDGIMTDDVQFFGEWNACACIHCQRLFKEKTGYEMPKAGKEWSEFYGDYDNPKYIAWERFRRDSTIEFQRNVNKHFENLGLKILRPNYASGAVSRNMTAYPFEEVADIWDWIFSENCFSTIINCSWPKWFSENLHRFSLAEKNNVPSMAMFYPDREDSYYFVWALAHSWGQLVMCTPEGVDLTTVEKKYRMFGKKYSNIYDAQKKLSDIAVMFSYSTANFIKDDVHRQSVISITQGMYFSNRPINIVFENDNYDRLKEYKLIILLNIELLKDEHIDEIKKYVDLGGKLLIVGGYPNNEVFKTLINSINVKYIEDNLKLPYYENCNTDRWIENPLKIDSPKYIVDELKEAVKSVIDPIHIDKKIQFKNIPNDWRITYYESQDSKKIVIHIINTQGILTRDIKKVNHDTVINSFLKEYVSDYKGDGEIIMDSMYGIASIKLITPEKENELVIEYEANNIETKFIVPKGSFNSYATIICEREKKQ